MHIWAPPSEILARVGDIRGPVAFDYETSGLFAADGARVSAASVAWLDPDHLWEAAGREGRVHWAVEEIGGGHEPVEVASVAWPFDQGVEGKPEDRGQDSLFESEWANLGRDEWIAHLDLLEQAGDYLGNQNIKFDLEKARYGCRRYEGEGGQTVRNLRRRVQRDTQIGNKLVWPVLGTTSLKPVSARLWGEAETNDAEIVKAYLHRQKLPTGRWDLMPWDVIGDYADQDSRLALRLMVRQDHELNQGLDWILARMAEGTRDEAIAEGWRLYNREIDVMRILDREEERGLPYAAKASKRWARELKARRVALEQGLPFEPDVNDAKVYFFTEGTTKRGNRGLGLVPALRTEKGAASLTEQVSQELALDEVPHAQDWIDWRKLSTAESMWYSGYADKTEADGRLRTHFRQVARADGGDGGTRSNRFSVERVNLQAIPQNYRLTGFDVMGGIPTPRQLIGQAVQEMDGWGLWELDLAQAELRVAAMLANCSSMLEMIEAGADLHTRTCADLFQMDEGADEFPKYRQVSKKGNFSLIFGVGWATLRAAILKDTGIRLGETQTQVLVRDWNNLYPEFKRAIDKHAGRVGARQRKYGYGWIDLINGQRRWFERYEDDHKAFNQRVQPNLAEFGKDWMIRSDAYLRDLGIDKMAKDAGIGGAGLVLTIHDSQVLLLPEELGNMIAGVCADFARELWDQYFPGVPGDVDSKRWDKVAA